MEENALPLVWPYTNAMGQRHQAFEVARENGHQNAETSLMLQAMQSATPGILVTAAPGKHNYGASQKGLVPAPMYPGGRDSATAVTFKVAQKEGWISFAKPEPAKVPPDMAERRRRGREATRRWRKGLPTVERTTKRMLSPVYVDALFVWHQDGYSKENRHSFQAKRTGGRHGHIWCHMWSDDLKSLHYMARKIGLQTEWFQNKPGFPHYDLVPTKREKAIAAGAIQYSIRAWIEDKAKKEGISKYAMWERMKSQNKGFSPVQAELPTLQI